MWLYFNNNVEFFSKISSVPFNLNAWPAYLLDEGDANNLTVGKDQFNTHGYILEEPLCNGL